ncbi:hypothetical protein ACTQ6A_12775 [Lachnospiraceae bacterium LCP25S3_G4]
MKKISFDEFMRLRKVVHRNARPLDYTMWKYLFKTDGDDDFLMVCLVIKMSKLEF